MRAREVRPDCGIVLSLPLWMLDGAGIGERSAYGRPATITGALWTPVGRQFDGTDDVILLPNGSAYNLLTGFTILGWIRPTALDNDAGGVARRFFTRTIDANNGFSIGVYGSRIQSSVRVAAAYTASKSKSDLSVNIWYHFAGVWNGAAMLVYVNGTASSQSGDALSLHSAEQTVVGARSTVAGFCKGTLGEIRLYNRAFGPLEVQHDCLATKWRHQ